MLTPSFPSTVVIQTVNEHILKTQLEEVGFV